VLRAAVTLRSPLPGAGAVRGCCTLRWRSVPRGVRGCCTLRSPGRSGVLHAAFPRAFGAAARCGDAAVMLRCPGRSAPKLLSAGRATSSSKHFFRDGASAPRLLSAGPDISPSKHFSGTERQPRNYFLQDVPPLRANTFSGNPGTTICRTCHLFEQTLSQGRSISPGTTFCRTCHLFEQTLSQGQSVSPGTTFCSATSSSNVHPPTVKGRSAARCGDAGFPGSFGGAARCSDAAASASLAPSAQPLRAASASLAPLCAALPRSSDQTLSQGRSVMPPFRANRHS